MELSTSLAWRANSMASPPSLHFTQPKSVFFAYNKKSIRVFCVNNNNNNAKNSSSNQPQDQEVCNVSSFSYSSTALYVVAPALVALWLSIWFFCVNVNNHNNAKNSSSNQPHDQKGKQMIVSITGATGFIGKRLVQRLLKDNHRVRVLTRSKSKAQLVFPANDFPGIIIAEEPEWKNSIQGSNAVVNLAGTPISTRWSSEIKKDIKQSRINVTSKVVDLINNSQDDVRPMVLVSASAVGYYGTSEVQVFKEQSPSGNDYLAEVCREWESTALKVNKDVKLARIRIGVVLGKDGGALAKMIPLFKLFAGGTLGSGRQWFSWIHLDDLVDLIYEALSNPSYEGVINGTAPNPVRMEDMCKHLGNILGRPSWLPVPGFALKAVLGEGASVVLLGQRVLPVRAEELGFSFKYPFLKDALKTIVSAEK